MKIYEIDPKILQTHAPMMNQMREEALNFAKNFQDSPENRSDWGHKYFCPDDGERLTFDFDKPHAHQCKQCGKVWQSEEFDNTWFYIYRRAAFETILQLAVLYQAEKKEIYMQEYKKILSFYAEHYLEFVYHSKHVICPHPPVVDGVLLDAGRIMPQALNEADMMVKIVTSFEILKGSLDQSFIDMVFSKMLKPAIEYCLKVQIVKVHNKPCLQDCCIGIVGLYMGDQELIDYAFDGEFGLNRQLTEGVTADKFWFEGSTHYHYFLLEGLVHLTAFAKAYGKEFAGEKIIADMLKAGYYYAFDNDIFPNPNDGWPNIALKTYDYTYALAAKAFGEDSEIGNIYKNIIANAAGKTVTLNDKLYSYQGGITLTHLMCFPYLDVEKRTAIPRASKCFATSYFAILKNPIFNVFLKYGHASPSHFHPDKMNVEATVNNHILSRDLSNPGYASKLYSVWYKRSISHNTVVVDGQDHQYIIPGEVLDYNENLCKTQALGAYDGVDFKRAIALQPEGFSDIFEVLSPDVHNYDYIFHCEAKLVSNLNTTACSDVGYHTNGYECFQDIQKVNCAEDSITLQWEIAETKLQSTIDLCDKELYIIKTYDNPASTLRTAIFLRQKGQNATFSIDWAIV